MKASLLENLTRFFVLVWLVHCEASLTEKVGGRKTCPTTQKESCVRSKTVADIRHVIMLSSPRHGMSIDSSSGFVLCVSFYSC
jgi:hypothetical protein